MDPSAEIGSDVPAKRQKSIVAEKKPTLDADADGEAPAKRQKSDPKSAIAERLEAKKKTASAPPVVAATWFYKSDLRKGAAKGEAWDPYIPADSATIEKGYQEYLTSKKKKNHAKLNDTYHVDFQDMTQFQTKDTTKQRPIKRV